MNKKLEALLKKKEINDVQDVIYDKLEEWEEAVYRGIADVLGTELSLLDFITKGDAENVRNYVVFSIAPLKQDSEIFYANISTKWIIEQLKRAQEEMIFPCRGRFEEKESANGMTYYVLI